MYRETNRALVDWSTTIVIKLNVRSSLLSSTAVSYTMPTAPSHLNAILIQPYPTREP